MTSNYKIVSANADITLNEVVGVATIDSAKLSTTPEDFVLANKLSYFVLANTWIKIVKGFTPYGAEVLKTSMIQNGLVSTIADASCAAEELASERNISNSLWASVYGELTYRERSGALVTYTWDHRPVSSFRAMNQMLKYPKRFSPILSDKLNADAKKRFDSFQRSARDKFKRDSFGNRSNYILRSMEAEMKGMVDWEDLCTEIESALEDPSNFILTHGTGYDARPIISDKLIEIAKVCGTIHPIMGTHVVSHAVSQLKGSNPETGELPVLIHLVPKNYKTPRVIAMEPTYRQARARLVSAILERHLPREIHLRDQAYNQIACREAALSGKYATIDFSNASDSVFTRFATKIFPSRFWNLIEPLLPTSYVWEKDGEPMRLQSAATMGNSLTFQLESLYFLCVARLATWYSRFSTSEPLLERWIDTDPTGKKRAITVPTVYGDDVIIVCEAVEALRYISDILLLTVNVEKSFDGTMAYRESCGVEYFRNHEVSIVYYPRRPIEGTITEEKSDIAVKYSRDSYTNELTDSLTSLVQLQQHLFSVDIGAAMFLKELVRWCVPQMTSSLPGTVSTDIWDYAEDAVVKTAPYAEISHFEGISADGVPTGIFYPRSRVQLITGTYLQAPEQYNWSKLATETQTRFIRQNRGETDTYVNMSVRSVRTLDVRLLQDIASINAILRSCPIQDVPFWEGKRTACLTAWLDMLRGLKLSDPHYVADGNVNVVERREGKLIPITFAEDDPRAVHVKRYFHLMPKTTRSGGTKVAATIAWKYNRFLEHGPQYEHSAHTFEGKLERLAGITVADNTAYDSKPELRWSLGIVDER